MKKFHLNCDPGFIRYMLAAGGTLSKKDLYSHNSILSYVAHHAQNDILVWSHTVCIQSKGSYRPIRAVGAGVEKAIDQSEWGEWLTSFIYSNRKVIFRAPLSSKYRQIYWQSLPIFSFILLIFAIKLRAFVFLI